MRYIEIIIVINVVIHIIFIRITNYLLNQKNSKLLITISSFIDAVYTLLYIMLPYYLEPYKYILIIVIAIMPFLKKGCLKALISILIYFMLNFMLGGTAELIYNVINNFYAVIIALVIVNISFLIYALYKKVNIKINNLNYNIRIKFNKKTFELNGYCDTGNFLKTEENIPVVFINMKYKIGRYIKKIEINSVSVSKEVPLFEVDEFLIKINNKYVKRDVYLSPANIAYQVMFGLDILGG